MRKIVLPLVETERSLLALQYVKKHFSKTQAEIIIVMADESLGISATREEEAAALAVVEQKLEMMKKVLNGYQVITKGFVGKAGAFIVKIAREYNADYIVMTKSAQPDTLSVVGKTTDYVLNNAYCNVLIISENRMNVGEYKGLIYKKAQATVNLRGQIGDKQSECLLPSVDADCNYHFEVTVGKIRFFHTAYNPETGNWDMPPSGDQTASIDIAAGETADILVNANSVEGKADRIRIINRGMKQEAVFGYKITAASAPQPLDIPDAPGAMPAPAVISLDVDDKTNDIAPEAAEDAEALLEDMPVPQIFETEETTDSTVRFGMPEEELELFGQNFETEPAEKVIDLIIEPMSGTAEMVMAPVEIDEEISMDDFFGAEEKTAEPEEKHEAEELADAAPAETEAIETEPETIELELEPAAEEKLEEEELVETAPLENIYGKHAAKNDLWDFNDINFDDAIAEIKDEDKVHDDLLAMDYDDLDADDEDVDPIISKLFEKPVEEPIANDEEEASVEQTAEAFEKEIEEEAELEEMIEKDAAASKPHRPTLKEKMTIDPPLAARYNPEIFEPEGAVGPAFNDIFDDLPTLDPILDKSSATLNHDFDVIINEFRTSQMSYVTDNIDDDIEKEH